MVYCDKMETQHKNTEKYEATLKSGEVITACEWFNMEVTPEFCGNCRLYGTCKED